MSAPRRLPRADREAVEHTRMEFLVKRDGIAAAAQWALRTLRIYRRAVLDPRHHASSQEYRRKFILSYCSFKAWLGGLRLAPSAGDPRPLSND